MLEFLTQNQLFIVLFIVLIIWFGIIIYLFTLENKLKKIENEINNSKGNKL
ncbi:MAG: CcmD family protein [Bacteroidetes bacterium]|nr:CcmD family protein [Bacteroidota bacterium]